MFSDLTDRTSSYQRIMYAHEVNVPILYSGNPIILITLICLANLHKLTSSIFSGGLITRKNVLDSWLNHCASYCLMFINVAGK